MVATTSNNNTSTAIQRSERTAIAHREADGTEGMSFGDLVGMGEHLVKTGFLPQHIKTGAQFAAIVLTGRELGMQMMRSVRTLMLVKGKVSEDAASQLARFKAAGGHATFKELSNERAVLHLRHPNGDEHTETFTADDAKAAGLNGDNWQKFRKAMLRSRVITAGLKSLGWEGAVGAYDPDELRGDPEPPPRAPPPPPDERAARHAAAVQALAEAHEKTRTQEVEDVEGEHIHGEQHVKATESRVEWTEEQIEKDCRELSEAAEPPGDIFRRLSKDRYGSLPKDHPVRQRLNDALAKGYAAFRERTQKGAA